jgi:hypothetical protein
MGNLESTSFFEDFEFMKNNSIETSIISSKVSNIYLKE